MEYLNRFAALSLDTHSEPSTTPPYPPTIPPNEKEQHAEMVAKIWKIDDEMKNTRFRNWKNDDTGFSSLVGRRTQQQQQGPADKTTETTHSFPSAFNSSSSSSSSYRTSSKFERSKPKIINTSSNTEFPSLASAKPKATGAWSKSFASTVSEMAERERIVNEDLIKTEEIERTRREAERPTGMVIGNRFRRRLEDILVEEQDDEYSRYDDNAFPDDLYEPTVEMETANDYAETEL